HPGREPERLLFERHQAGQLVGRCLLLLVSASAGQCPKHGKILPSVRRLSIWGAYQACGRFDRMPIMPKYPQGPSPARRSAEHMSEVTSERQIVITDSAARRIAALKAQEEAGDAFLRIAGSGGGCS